MTPDLASAEKMAGGLSQHGLFYVIAVLAFVIGIIVPAMAVYIVRLQGQRVDDAKTYAAETKANLEAAAKDVRTAQDQRVAMAESVIPVAQNLATGVVALKAVAQELLDATPPRRRRGPELVPVPAKAEEKAT